jgi:hypothetical protein
MQHEKPAIDEHIVAGWLLVEPRHGIAVQRQRATPRRWRHSRQRRRLAMRAVEIAQGGDVGDAVAIGHAETLIGIEIPREPLEPAAGHRLLPSIHHSHPPRLGIIAVIGDLAAPRIHGHIGGIQHVIRKIFLDHVATVTQRDDEIGRHCRHRCS